MEVWIGLATVHQRPGAGVLMDQNDAYVQSLALASSADEFREAIRAAFDCMGFDLTDLEDIDPLAERLALHVVDPLLLSKADEVRATGFPRFGDFHTWICET